MSEELLSKEAGRKKLTPPGFAPLTSRSLTTIDSKMKSESVKKSLEKSKNVLEEKRQMVKQKICIKTPTRLQ